MVNVQHNLKEAFKHPAVRSSNWLLPWSLVRSTDYESFTKEEDIPLWFVGSKVFEVKDQTRRGFKSQSPTCTQRVRSHQGQDLGMSTVGSLSSATILVLVGRMLECSPASSSRWQESSKGCDHGTNWATWREHQGETISYWVINQLLQRFRTSGLNISVNWGEERTETMIRESKSRIPLLCFLKYFKSNLKCFTLSWYWGGLHKTHQNIHSSELHEQGFSAFTVCFSLISTMTSVP